MTSLLDQIEAFNEEFPCPICKYGVVILNNDYIYQCDKCDYRGWIFTFGFSHKYPNSYIIIYGTEKSSRDKMMQMFGREWAFQYETKEQAGVEKFNLNEVFE